MKRDVNATLMIILLLTVFSILVLILYNTFAYHNLGSRYKAARMEITKAYVKLNVTKNELDAKNKELSEREAALAEKERQMEEYFQDLNLSKQRESSLGVMFDDLRDDNSQLRRDVSGLNTRLDEKDRELQDITVSYNKKVADYEDAAFRFQQTDAKLAIVGRELDDIKSLVDGIERLLDSIEAEGNSSIRSDAKSANNKREDVEDKIAVVENNLLIIENWAKQYVSS